jgi:hypothetical protein
MVVSTHVGWSALAVEVGSVEEARTRMYQHPFAKPVQANCVAVPE